MADEAVDEEDEELREGGEDDECGGEELLLLSAGRLKMERVRLLCVDMACKRCWSGEEREGACACRMRTRYQSDPERKICLRCATLSYVELRDASKLIWLWLDPIPPPSPSPFSLQTQDPTPSLSPRPAALPPPRLIYSLFPSTRP